MLPLCNRQSHHFSASQGTASAYTPLLAGLLHTVGARGFSIKGATVNNQGIQKLTKERLIRARRVDPISGCWVWTKGRTSRGYGALKSDGVQLGAHRVAYELWIRPIPIGLCVCHKCDNPSCFNPKHLFVGTVRDNTQDAFAKGRRINPKGERHPSSKLTQSQVLEIYATSGNYGLIASRFGITKATVCDIKRGKRWKHLKLLPHLRPEDRK